MIVPKLDFSDRFGDFSLRWVRWRVVSAFLGLNRGLGGRFFRPFPTDLGFAGRKL